MNPYALRSALVSTLGVALALASGAALAATYRLTDLGTLGGTSSGGVRHQRLGAGDGLRRYGRRCDRSRLPVGRHEDAGPRHAGGHV